MNLYRTVCASLFVMIIIGMSVVQATGKEEEQDSPAVLVKQVSEAAGVSVTSAILRWNGEAGVADGPEAFKQLADTWTRGLQLPQGNIAVSSDGLLSYTSEIVTELGEVRLTVHAREHGGPVHISVSITAANLADAEIIQRSLEVEMINQIQAEIAPLSWNVMIRGDGYKDNKHASEPRMWGEAIGGKLIGQYHDHSTSSYSFESKQGPLQVMLHRHTEDGSAEIIIGYPAISSLN